MKLYTSVILIVICINVHSQIRIQERVVSPGVTYQKIINESDTLTIDILKIDLSNDDYLIKSVKAGNLLNVRKTTSNMAKAFTDSGYNVIAAINADFFESDGEVVNNMISEGQFIKAVKFTDSPFNKFVNSQFAITCDNQPLIEQFVFSGNLILPDGTIESISRINSKADSNSITLYNSYQGKKTPDAPENWIVSEAVLIPLSESGDTVFFIVGSQFYRGGNQEIPETGFILSANQKYAYYLEKSLFAGDTIKVLLRLTPPQSGIISLTGGWPLLVKDGYNVVKSDPNIEGVIPRFSENRHPRTGIGVSEDSTIVYFITVDGRQSHSKGMSLVEFADFMINEGVYQGLNLDGGGSTVMIINNVIVNSPSDVTGEREVGNCLLLLKRNH